MKYIYIAQKQMPMDKRFVNKTYSIISYNISFDIGIYELHSLTALQIAVPTELKQV